MIGKIPGTVQHITINLSLAKENTFEYDVNIYNNGNFTQCCGSGSLYHQAKKNKKNLDSKLFCDSFMTFLYLKNYVNVPSKSNGKHNKFVCWRLEGH